MIATLLDQADESYTEPAIPLLQAS